MFLFRSVQLLVILILEILFSKTVFFDFDLERTLKFGFIGNSFVLEIVDDITVVFEVFVSILTTSLIPHVLL